MRYVALVRGINVGGHHKLPMADLRRLLEDLGHEDVETLGASGNALLTAKGGAAEVNAAIEAALAERMGKPIPVVLRSRPQWRKVLDADPFPQRPTKDQRLAVTFLREPLKAPLPEVPGIEVVHRTPGEVFAVWTLQKGRPPAFTKHEAALGVPTTTRFWSVVREIGERLV